MGNVKEGLNSNEVQVFLKRYGQNVLSEQKKKNIFIKFFEQFNNFLTILLMIAGGFSFLIGEAVDGGLIFAIVILNALFGIYQESKAEESIAALKKMTVTKVRVMRDGKEQEIDSRFIVPGDIMFIEEGTKIVADGSIIEALNMEVNESTLTGESIPVVKKSNTLKQSGNDTKVFSGTIVSKGRGWVEVTQTGMNTEFGKIALELSGIEDTLTPLQIKLKDLTRMIGIVGIILAIVVFILSFLENPGGSLGARVFPAFLLAISLAVAVVPEGLPAVMTITLAIGVKKMANKRAIIRKLSAIEALGSITLIATDKTGTLTTNKMKVNELMVDGKIYESKSFPALKNYPFSLMILDGILCSTASLSYSKERDSYEVLGDPTEGALLYLAQEVDFVPDVVKKEWKLIDEKPFDSVTKKMSVIVQKGKQRYMFSKGAPESILAGCTRILIGTKEEEMTERQKGIIEKQVEKWAMKGLRVLAFSYSSRSSSSSRSDLGKVRPNSASVFLGLVAIHDAPRPEINEAVKRAHEAGIKVVMITGDNEKTAEAVGVVAGLMKKGDEVMNGEEIDRYSDEELMSLLPKVRIFARTSPFQKHRIVKLFQQLGEIVAVTGDGVNDAIALKQADVGVAMGLVGTDVARETADMVITDDNFATIVNAVEEGRNIIQHLKNAIKYLLSCNMSEAIALVIGLILGIPTLFYAIQLLYINLVTDGVPALALGFSPRNPRIMQMSPEKELSLLDNKERQYIAFVGSFAAVLVLIAYFIFVPDNLGKTAAFSVLTLLQSFIFMDVWLSHRSLRKNIPLLQSPLFLFAFSIPFLFQYFIVHQPFIASVFKIQTTDAGHYMVFIMIAAIVFGGIKGIKMLLRI